MQLNKLVPRALLTPIPRGVGDVSGWRDVHSSSFHVVEESGEQLVTIAEYAPNVLGKPAYHDGSQYVRRTVADMLTAAQKLLPADFQLVLFDGWRSLATQHELYQKEYEKQMDHSETQKYVSLPSDNPNIPSPHNTGGAVDVGILYRGKLLDFGTGFDHMDRTSHLMYCEETDGLGERARDSRRILYNIMTKVDFEAYAEEWWHFNYGNQMAATAHCHQTGECISVKFGTIQPS